MTGSPPLPTLDYEVYSEAGYRFDCELGYFVKVLPKSPQPGIGLVGAAVYAEHPSTRIISFAYDLLDGIGERMWFPGDPEPQDLRRHILAGGIIEAHNSLFEHLIWLHQCHIKLGWVDMPLDQWRCSAAKARAHSMPGKLGDLTAVLNPDLPKDPRGKKLINLLCIHRRPTKDDPSLFRTAAAHPELHSEMYEYNATDIRSQRGVSVKLPELSATELAVWQLDQEINARGIAIDTESLDNCIAVFRQASDRYTAELVELTGGAVTSVDLIRKGSAGGNWLAEQGVYFDSLAKDAVDNLLAGDNLPPVARRVLEIRQILGQASVKKLFAGERTTCSDGRIRDLFMFCGADRTARWAGRGFQPQNLKNHGPDCVECSGCGRIQAASVSGPCCPICGDVFPPERLEWGNKTALAALKTIASRDLDTVERQWGGALDVITSCLRSLFIAAPGHDLICSDYSAIEAVVLAVEAGEEWRLEVFRTHGKIYEASAAKAFNVPLEDILSHKETTGRHHPLRKKGKLNELSLGYNGWIGASKAFGAIGTDEDLKQNILAWRAASPMIEEFWGGQWRKEPNRWRFTPEFYGLEGAAVQAILNRGQAFGYRAAVFQYHPVEDCLYEKLPSSRCLKYHEPRLSRGNNPMGNEVWQISYMGWNSDSMKGAVGWVRLHTYSGKIAENRCQAIARDILAAAMLRLKAAGYKIVLHVHDEVIVEVPHGFGSVEDVERIMMIREPWFADWPIKAAGGWIGKRYRK